MFNGTVFTLIVRTIITFPKFIIANYFCTQSTKTIVFITNCVITVITSLYFLASGHLNVLITYYTYLLSWGHF